MSFREGRIFGVERRFLLFLAVGGLNTLFGYGLFVALVALRLPIPVAMLLSTVGGVLFNFRTTGGIVFASRDASRIVRFVAVYALLYGANLAGLNALMAMGLGVYLASALLLAPMALLAYALNKTFVFREAA